MESHIETILWNQNQIASRVTELAAQISADLLDSPPAAFVGVATGAFLFLADLVRQINLPITVDFIRVESYGCGTESSGKPRISSDLKLDVCGKHVILVEDIVDSGRTLECVIEHMKLKGASCVSVCTFLDKPSRRKIHLQLVGQAKFYSGFQVTLLCLFH
uniref:Phosphoribosyltransferase domain-containing protein n=1 Tax=Cannabis sativa TaxID=3483 RepID=A0A803NIQ8_CANSA